MVEQETGGRQEAGVQTGGGDRTVGATGHQTTTDERRPDTGVETGAGSGIDTGTAGGRSLLTDTAKGPEVGLRVGSVSVVGGRRRERGGQTVHRGERGATRLRGVETQRRSERGRERGRGREMKSERRKSC